MRVVSRRPSPLPTGWGVVSTGHIARAFAEDLARVDRPDIVAVCSRSLTTAKEFVRQHSGATRTGKLRSVRPYDDPAAMMADPAVEMIYVASLNIAHVDATRLGIEAGKPTLCEKPMALSAPDATELAELARSRGVFLMEGLWTRHLPAVQALKALVDMGAIGKVTSVAGWLHADRPYDPRSRLFDPDQGGGALHDLGVYPLSLAVQYIGEPERIEGRWWANPSGTDGRAEVTLSGKDISARIGCGFTAGVNRFEVHGDGGTLVLDSALNAKSILHYPAGASPPPEPDTMTARLKEWWAASAGEVVRRDYPFEGNGLRFQAIRMAECVRDGMTECPEAPLTDTLSVLKVIDTVLATEPAGAV